MSKIARRAAHMALAGMLAALCAGAHADDTLRVGKAVVENFGFIPLDIGMKAGLFAKEGLTIDEINFTGGAKLAQGVTAGAVDIALSGGPDMAYAAKGAPQIAIASITSSPAFIGITVGSQSTARGLDDLKGKKIGVTSAGSLTDWLVDELNRVKGWSGDNDRAMAVAIGGSPTTAFAALKTGQVDASVGAVPVGYQLEELHAGRLLVDVSAYVTSIELFVTFGSTAIVQKNPGAVRRFLKAWYATIAYMKTHRAETVTVTAEVIGYSPTVAERTYDELMAKFSSDGKFDPKALEKLSASFADLKILDSSADLSKLYTEEFLPKP
ncbi:MAG TPA: ABC transporter substrate-binding protein [Stellaceae bacterium]|nr:ABC transporter substrate-binding protein [Stellaceae bacterium]